MKEYIDREALLKKLCNDNPANMEDYYYNAIKNAPVADVKEVVRCRDCKYARESQYAFEFDGLTPLCECDFMTQPNRWHEYCSWGEKIEVNEP